MNADQISHLIDSTKTPTVCRNCDEYVTTVPQFIRDYRPEQVAEWHSTARCCETVEPIR
jgi:hypothetical protein